ncbi:MAG: D-TA family PLP-dependent enzyme [Pirellulaceae bacterium]
MTLNLERAGYTLKHPEELLTPCLLVYPELIKSNLEAMLAIAGGASRLRPHVKTHKTPEIVQLALDSGIVKHKCATLREAEMLAECGVPDVLVAYPQVGPAIERFVQLVSQHGQTHFSTIVDDPGATKRLGLELDRQGLKLDVLVDIDNGMHRTGIPVDAGAAELCRLVAANDSMRFAGLHVYDGQNHQPSLAERQLAVAELLKPVIELVDQLASESITVPKLVCGGTPTFAVFAATFPDERPVAVEFSPGTCVLSDFNYGRDYPDLNGIRNAAVLMTRVISKQPGAEHFTCDLGNKAIAADPPSGERCHFLGLTDVALVKQNEEHLMVRCAEAQDLKVGDVLYALPAHICPTTALHQFIHPVEGGQIVGRWEVNARDRIYSI